MPNRFLPSLLLSFLLAIPVGVLAENQRVQLLGMTSQVPPSWVPEQTASDMRLLQFRIPGAEGSEGAVFIVYYFGPNQGGSAEANLARWRSQFSNPDGGEVEPVVSTLEGAQPATLVELEGSYARSVGMGQTVEPQPSRMLLAAVVETTKGNLYPQLHGPVDLVKAQRAGFVAFVEGLTADPAP